MSKTLNTYLPLFLFLTVLTAGLFFTVSDLPSQALCIYKRLYHMDCPGCGLTRAFLLIPQGQFFQALQLNAASIALYFLFIFMVVSIVGKKLNFKALESTVVKKFRLYLCLLVAVLLSGHWLLKMGDYFTNQSLSEYLTNLITSQNFWVLWV